MALASDQLPDLAELHIAASVGSEGRRGRWGMVVRVEGNDGKLWPWHYIAMPIEDGTPSIQSRHLIDISDLGWLRSRFELLGLKIPGFVPEIFVPEILQMDADSIESRGDIAGRCVSLHNLSFSPVTYRGTSLIRSRRPPRTAVGP